MVVKLVLKRKNENIQIWSRCSLFKNTGCRLPASSSAALTHSSWVMHICIGNVTIIGSDNDLSPGQRQAIIWTNTGILLIKPLGTKFSENLIKIHIFSFKKLHLQMSSVKLHPSYLCLKEAWTKNQSRDSCDEDHTGGVLLAMFHWSP